MIRTPSLASDMIDPMFETAKGVVVRRKRRQVAVALAATLAVTVALGCSETKKPAGAKASQAEPLPTEEVVEAPSPLRDAFDALPASPPLLPPLEHQLGTSYIQTTFLGFTKDYRAYALRISHDYAFDDGEGSFNMDIHQVIDTWTGEGIAAYEIRLKDKRDEKAADNSYHRSMQRFATQLESDRAWKSWLAQNPLIEVKARRKTEKGEFSIELTGRAPLQSTIDTSNRSFGFEIKWSNLPTGEVFEAVKRKPRAPRLLASWTPKGGDKQPSVSFRPEMAWVNWSGDARHSKTRMLVKAYPTPDERRVLWLLQPNPNRGDTSKHDPVGRIFMRALGRQIKVVHAGSGVDPARRASAHLEANGMTVAAISKQAKESDVSGIYYRGDALELAKNIQTLLPGSLPIEELQAQGWVDVIIVLGKDVGPTRKKLAKWGGGTKAAAEPATPVNLTAMIEPATDATDNCPTVLINALDGDTRLDDVRLQEECEEAPDYECEDNGEGCATTTYEIGKQVTIEGRPYIWIHTIYAMEDNEIRSSALYGYGCGQLGVAFSFTSQDQGDVFAVELLEEQRGLKAVTTATLANGGAATTSNARLAWDAAQCVYRPKS